MGVICDISEKIYLFIYLFILFYFLFIYLFFFFSHGLITQKTISFLIDSLFGCLDEVIHGIFFELALIVKVIKTIGQEFFRL